jgi:hypothetical protein
MSLKYHLSINRPILSSARLTAGYGFMYRTKIIVLSFDVFFVDEMG